MDRVISQKSGRFIRFLPWVGATIAIVAVIYFFATYQNATFAIENTRISIAPVIDGEFDDYVPIRGRVTPLKTVYLDMIEGGQVQKRMVEDGAMVKAGDLLVSLNNTSLQLDVSRNEAMVTEQLNNMRSIELQLEQNHLQHKRALVEMDYQIQRLVGHDTQTRVRLGIPSGRTDQHPWYLSSSRWFGQGRLQPKHFGKLNCWRASDRILVRAITWYQFM